MLFFLFCVLFWGFNNCVVFIEIYKLRYFFNKYDVNIRLVL